MEAVDKNRAPQCPGKRPDDPEEQAEEAKRQEEVEPEMEQAEQDACPDEGPCEAACAAVGVEAHAPEGEFFHERPGEDGEKDDRGPTWDEIKDLLRKEAEKIQDGSIELTELLQKWGIIPETPKTPEELMDLVYVQGIKRLEELNEKYGVDLPKLSVLDLLDKVPDIPGGNGSETWDFENGKLGTGFSFDADGIKNTTVLTIGNNFGIQFELGYNFDNGFGDWSTYEDIADKNIGDLMGGSPYLKISLYYTW